MARKRVQYVQKLLEDIGLEGQRIQMVNLSSAMAPQFAELATEFTTRIRDIGPSPLGWNWEARLNGKRKENGQRLGDDPSGHE
jgi:coenzyme F420-reducing hydrogenase delta subunit